MGRSSDSARKKPTRSAEFNNNINNSTSRFSNFNSRLVHGGNRVSTSSSYNYNNNNRSERESDRVLFGYGGGSSGVCDGGGGGEVSLREWLDRPERHVDASECVHVFRQVAEIVGSAHSQGIAVHNVRPSCFVMSGMNRVSFIESASDSDDGEEAAPTAAAGSSEASCMQSGSSYAADREDKSRLFPMKQVLAMEASWYSSPEESDGAPTSFASDIYRLGVLLFELFCPCEDKSQTMCSLRHRVLPPLLLLKWPKEASFCLWLLHPEPASRPKISELLQSEFLNEQRAEMEEREASIELRERIEEQELLLDFLFAMQRRKQETAHKLQHTLSFLASDIDEVTTLLRKKKTGSCPDLTNLDDEESASRKRFRPGLRRSLDSDEREGGVVLGTSRVMKNFKKLEAAYFTTRTTERSSANRRRSGWISPFLDGLCKYLSFTGLRARADLKQGGDLLNSSNLVCSLGFDRDGELFATAGVNKKIKVFECDSIVNEDRDIHYPLVEMSTRSKLSSISWNSYIKSQIASSNFEGVVQVWDVSRSQVQMEMREHEKRVWSIDFSSADPTLLASGSDDGSVKLWSINQGVSVGTIRTKANVCCVQFPTDSGRSIAFGSADHKIYYYDLRNAKAPLCTFAGHNKTVSYVKFVDSTSLVSASTDNTLKLWDLSSCSSRVVETPLQTYTGHTNVKNFVGLSVSDGYIATGSETNEVFIYHKAFPMPALSFKFNSSDPISGHETDDSAQFISSVCWRGQSNTLVAANSTGNIKILEMV